MPTDKRKKHNERQLKKNVNQRTMEERQIAADLFFEVFTKHFQSQSDKHGMALSFEMKELEPVLKFNKNNIQDHL